MKNLSFPIRILSLSVFSLCATALSLRAQIDYAEPGTVYTQDFNTLPARTSEAWKNGETLPGWTVLYLRNHEAPTSIKPRTGASSLGGIGSFGNIHSTNRSLGATPGTSLGDTCVIVSFRNTSGRTLTEMTITYTGQLWRIIGIDPKALLVSYRIGKSWDEAESDWVAAPELIFDAPVLDPMNTGLEGGASENSQILSATISGIDWRNGEELHIRFFQVNNIANKAFAIDDFSFQAESTDPVK